MFEPDEDISAEFDELSCNKYDLTILRYSFNVLEASLIKHIFDYPGDTFQGLEDSLVVLNRLLYKLIHRHFGPGFASTANEASNGVQVESKTYNVIENLDHDSFTDVVLSPMNALNSTNNSVDINIPFHTSTQPSMIASHLDQSLNNSGYFNPNNSEFNQNMIEYNRNISEYNRNNAVVYENDSNASELNRSDQTINMSRKYNRTLPALALDPNQTRPVNVDLGITLPGQSVFNQTMISTGNLNRTLPVADSILNHQPISIQPSLASLRPRRKIGKIPRWTYGK
ncbi:unnamed protein product [Diamesa serratosioi]